VLSVGVNQKFKKRKGIKGRKIRQTENAFLSPKRISTREIEHPPMVKKGNEGEG